MPKLNGFEATKQIKQYLNSISNGAQLKSLVFAYTLTVDENDKIKA